MIINALILIVLGVLILASFLDLKYKAIPSILLTGMLFIVLIMRIENIGFGIAAGVFAWFIRDLLSMKELEFGLADIKIIITIGLMISSINFFLIFIGIFAVFQLVYTIAWEWKVGKDKERPFVPCLLAIYMAMMLIGGLI